MSTAVTLGETLHTNGAGLVALGGSVAVMAAATIALAHSQASSAPSDEEKTSLAREPA